jgi:RimJ/RimL family protein N-acetyltransferase
MHDVRIVPTEDRYLESFRAALDTVARERRYLVFLEAPPIAAVRRFVAETIAGGGVQVIAVDATDQVVGWCDIVRYQREGYRHAGVLGIGLVPGFRERGLGARLALAAIDAARRNGIERIELEVLASNERAIALYRQLGFVDEGVKRGARKLDGRYEDKLFMALLDAPASR